MILEYEEALVRQLYDFEKSLKRIEFVDDFDTAYQLWKSIEYPICQIYRSFPDDMLWPRSFDYEDDKEVVKLFTATLQYQVKIWYSKESTAIMNMQRFRFFCERNPYVLFDFEGAPYRIGKRYTRLGITTYRNNDNEKGAMRAIESTFESTIPFSENEDIALIKEVKIGVNGMEIKTIK